MASPQCGFSFGATEEGEPRVSVLERLHLATRGAGDLPALARALGECRRSRRYITEGSRVFARRAFDAGSAPTNAVSGETSNSEDTVTSNPTPEDTSASRGPTHTPCPARSDSVNALCRDYRSADGAQADAAACSGAEGPSSSGSHSSRRGSPRRLYRYSETDSSYSQPDVPESSPASLFRVCSAAFDLTRSLSRGRHASPDDGIEYVVVKCEPPGGYVGENTLFYADERLPTLRRIDFLWDVESDSHLRRCVDHLLGPSDPGNLTKALLMRQDRLFGPYHVSADAADPVPTSSRLRKTIFLNRPHRPQPGNLTGSSLAPLEPDAAIEALIESMFRSVLADTLSSDFRVFYPGQTATVRDLRMFVSSTSPCRRPGIIAPSTDVYVGVDTVGECTSVSVAPLRDTLPTTYEYNLLRDCVEPYFRGHRARTFRVDDTFRFGGVQFRVVGFGHREEPPQLFDFDLLNPFPRHGTCGRVGARSTINVNEAVDPRLTDLLSAEQRRHLRRCAPNQRELLLFKLASQLDADSIARLHGTDDGGRRGAPFDRIDTVISSRRLSCCSAGANTVQEYSIRDTSDATTSPISGSSEDVCTVCCELVVPSGPAETFRYPCGHVFHASCAREWMNMCGMSCPNCRYSQLGRYSSDDLGSSGQFHTLSDCDETDLSDYRGSAVAEDSVSSSGVSELLHWFNSQEA
ncbi:RING zinc finger protein, putative [Babesia caballi]|uniref:RING zinc finger protein, putative n=1 Tax=Babesia caballi TaxID=5871 RepID=A0AAV4LVS4_BABCB|nr:RING zinc finger protein, putative [Babesia caballi]